MIRGTLAELFPAKEEAPVLQAGEPLSPPPIPRWTPPGAFFSKDFFFLGFRGCALEGVLASLHRGCFEASPYGDFVATCVPELGYHPCNTLATPL